MARVGLAAASSTLLSRTSVVAVELFCRLNSISTALAAGRGGVGGGATAATVLGGVGGAEALPATGAPVGASLSKLSSKSASNEPSGRVALARSCSIGSSSSSASSSAVSLFQQQQPQR